MDDFIFGEPIQTKYGLVRFLKYKEFSSLKIELHFINLNVLHLYYLYMKNAKTDEEKGQIEEIKKKSLFEIVKDSKQLVSCYILVLQKVLDINGYTDNHMSAVIKSIFTNEEDFLFYRKLIQDMNFLIEDEVSPNPEIQKFIDKKNHLKSRKQKKDENPITNIVTSLVCGTSLTFSEIGEMTLMQVNASYQKLNHFKNFDVTTLFATVSKTEIESWNEPITSMSEEKSGMDSNQFSSQFGSMIK